ncbi:MAG TPA: hypothetical protein VFB78_08960 [Acidimicrobiales bacterium]|nr:hypothetical protein [Acidimicrobiales bacterium]
MTQPEYVPIIAGDRVRGAERLPVPTGWAADRPAETARAMMPRGPRLGSVGPDQGYAMLLARRFHDRIELTSHEHREDAVAGCVPVATKRAARLGRAPVIYDLEHAFTLWGFLGGAPQELIDLRAAAFQGAAHDYWIQRAIVDQVPDETLALSPAVVRERLPVWRTLFSA